MSTKLQSNRVTIKIKTRYYLELLTPETMKLLRSTEEKITKDKNGDNVPHLEITEVVLLHCTGFDLTTCDSYFTIQVFTNHILAVKTYFTNHLG